MSYEESKLFSLLKKQDIDSLFLEATNYLCQTKSLFEEKERLQQENQELKDNWKKLKEYIRETKLKEFEKSFGKRYAKTFTQAEVIVCNMIIDKMRELEQGSDSNE